MTTCIEHQSRNRLNGGYVRIRRGNKMVLAHRDAYQKAHGPIPDGMVVRHKCDNPPCINVEHLELGTQTDNMRDMVQRGRANPLYGSDHPNSALSEQDRTQIVMALSQPYYGITVDLARQYGITPQRVGQIGKAHGLAGRSKKAPDRD